MTKILWLGDVAHSGFGSVTWGVGERLLTAGHDLRLIAQNMTGDPVPEPLGSRTWDVSRVGNQVPSMITQGFTDGWKPDAVIILGDYFACRTNVLGHPVLKRAYASVPTFHYCPIEGVDLPPRWKELWDIVRPVAMSNFGADEIAKVTGTQPPMIYHGVSEDFYPVSANRPGRWQGEAVTTKLGAKRVLKYPEDRIMVLRTDRHMPRKRYNSLLRAMPAVFNAVPNLDLVIHCRIEDQGGNLVDSISKMSDEHQKRVILTGAHDSWTGLSRPALNVLYNAADIYVSTSAEGFGLTVAEAVACGVPAVALDYSSVPEVVGPAGVLVPVSGLIDNEYDHSWAAIDEPALAAALIRLAQKPSLRRELGSQGPSHVARNFTWDAAAQGFADLVTAAAQEKAA